MAGPHSSSPAQQAAALHRPGEAFDPARDLDMHDQAVLRDLADRRWRICNLYWILPKEGEKPVLFQPNWAQLELLDTLWWNTCVLKARQLGISTLFHLLALDTALFTTNFAAALNSYDLPSIQKLMRRNIVTPYEHLPESLRAAIPETGRALFGTAPYIRWANGSRIEGALTARGDTYQYLHVSEMGKTAAKNPKRADELFTGSMQTVLSGSGLRIIESTAEGEEGAFAEVCQAATDASAAAQAEQRPLTIEEWKLVFLPWWRHPEYQMDPSGVTISPEDQKYFAGLEAEHVPGGITARQRAWYVSKKNGPRMGSVKMRKEYPSTPQEAFAGSSEGSVYGEQMANATARGRITRVPVTIGVPVDTSWDLGVHDYTAIWLWQWIGREPRAVGYIYGSGQPWSYYAQQLWEWRADGIQFRRHYLPHDGRNRQQAGSALKSTWELLEENGIAPTEIVETPDLLVGVQLARSMLSMVHFDAEACADGIKALRRHKKEWSERLSAYVDRPRHDEWSHGASAFRIYAQATEGGTKIPGGRNTKRSHYPSRVA